MEPGNLSARDRLRTRLAAVESDIDAGRYQPGPWQTFLREVRALPRADRTLLAGDITRVSNKLHARGRKRIPVTAAVLAELALASIGAVLLWMGNRDLSNAAAIAATLVWITAFQPLIKVTVGRVLGIRYAYAYFLGMEPRFKMCLGDYISAPRGLRILFHLSGAIGSPLGAWLPTLYLRPALGVAIRVCWATLSVLVIINVVPFLAALAGLRRLGPLRLSLVSSAVAATEIREALSQ